MSSAGRQRPRTLLALAPLMLLAALLTSCGHADHHQRNRLPPPQRGQQDLNPRDPATLRDGGDLRIPLDYLPPNFNFNTVQGHESQTLEVLSALMPRAFTDTADGGQAVDPDFVSSAELVSTVPQVVHYHVNDRAVWTNGRPITWQDFAAQANANNGKNPAFRASDKTGYQDVRTVQRGATDKDVLVTFSKPFAEWESLFSCLYPVETNSDPKVFNTGWASGPLETAGPFKLGAIDRTGETLTLVRNERWWGPRPRLDRVIFTVTSRAALAERLANNEIDLYEIGSSVDLYRQAKKMPGIEIRQAMPEQYTQITFNGAPNRVLSDLRLRQAIAHAINRAAVARKLLGQIVPGATTMDNHIYPVGSTDYRNNSDVLPYDRDQANRELDALGWVRSGPSGIRTRNGQPLTLMFVVPAGNPVSNSVAKVVLDQLAKVGVQVVIDAVPLESYFSDHVLVGDFDLTAFQWVHTSAPFASSAGVYQQPVGNDIGGNYGRVHDTQVSALFAQGLAELDNTKRARIGNQLDRLIWREVHDLPVYPQSGAFAVRATLANFGARGLGDWDFVRAGFTR